MGRVEEGRGLLVVKAVGIHRLGNHIAPTGPHMRCARDRPGTHAAFMLLPLSIPAARGRPHGGRSLGNLADVGGGATGVLRRYQVTETGSVARVTPMQGCTPHLHPTPRDLALWQLLQTPAQCNAR